MAANSAMFDHLAVGRFILGRQPGRAGLGRRGRSGILDEDRNKMFAEAIDVITAIWEREPPYEIAFPDNRFPVDHRATMDLDLGVGVLPKPLQTPRPEIVGTVVAPFSKGVIAMGAARLPPAVGELPAARSGWRRTGRTTCRARSRRPVAADRPTGGSRGPSSWPTTRRWPSRYGSDDADSPYRFYYSQMLTKMRKLGRLELFKTHRDQPDDEVTLDDVLDAS